MMIWEALNESATFCCCRDYTPRVRRGAVCNRRLRSEYANDISSATYYTECYTANILCRRIFSRSTRIPMRRSRQNASSNFRDWRTLILAVWSICVISFNFFKSKQETNKTDREKNKYYRKIRGKKKEITYIFDIQSFRNSSTRPHSQSIFQAYLIADKSSRC